ncbi:MAG TPA: SPOR domain-containing protein [Blastocatellia bacterium]|nr:SPOR domain-containing protein [Blastocatellia bacterium]
MTNKQVVAIFIIGIALLLGAFWAGLYVVRQDTAANANQGNAANQNSQNQASQPATRPPPATPTPQPPPASSDARYVVQVGASFGTAEKANELTAQLKKKYASAYTQGPTSSDTLYRVRIGPYSSREDAQQVATELSSQGFKGVMIFPWAGN